MTSYLVMYLTHGARLFGHDENSRGVKLSRFGVLPHEIAALNARRAAEAQAASMGAADRVRDSSFERGADRAPEPLTVGAVR
jgi:hypothetical protein